MIRAAVADQQIEQVHFPKIIPAVASCAAGRDEMFNPVAQAPDWPPVSRVIIAAHAPSGMFTERDLEQVRHVYSQRTGVGPAQVAFQIPAASLLVLCHTALPPQLGVTEVDEEIGAFFDRDVVVKREVLAEFERLESINDNIGCRARGAHEICVKKKAVPAEPAQMSVHRFWCDVQIPRDLSVRHTADGLHEDGRIEVGELLPVGCAERLATERTSTVAARKPLDTLRVLVSSEESSLLVSPISG